MIREHSRPCFIIGINKRLIRHTILISSVAVVAIRRISEPIEV